ncbi:hypothetical protein Tco_0047511 [Tanacetum coccineum]
MLDKDLYDSWKSIMELYMQNREHERMILESVENSPLIWPTIEENGVARTKKYVELSVAEKIQADCFVVPIFSLGDDPIACLNKVIAFLTAVASSSATSSGKRCKGHARLLYATTCQGEGHMASKCTQPKRPRNAAWYKDKAMLAEAQEVGQFLMKSNSHFLQIQGSNGSSSSNNKKRFPHSQTFSNYGSDVISEI